MAFFWAIVRMFRRRTPYERLVHEWMAYEQSWQLAYERADLARRRELVDALREERQMFFARKLELERIEKEVPYEPVVLPGRAHKTAGEILVEKGYDLGQK